MKVYVDAVGLCAPGLPGWRKSCPVLSGDAPYEAAGALPEFGPLPLPRNEARRLTLSIRLALQVAQEALSASEPPGELGAVFACSGGNAEALDKLFTALLVEGHPVSPSQFNHSVHNAPLGYWSIATGCRAPSTSIGAYDASFAAGLLEAGGLVTVEGLSVLLVAYDMPPPQALLPFRSVNQPFATALLLSAELGAASRSCLQLQITRTCARVEDRMVDASLERLRTDNPAARSLPLLSALAEGRARSIVLPYLGQGQLVVEHQPC